MTTTARHQWTLNELVPAHVPHKMRSFYNHTSKLLAEGGTSVKEAQRLLLEERAQLLSESKSSGRVQCHGGGGGRQRAVAVAPLPAVAVWRVVSVVGRRAVPLTSSCASPNLFLLACTHTHRTTPYDAHAGVAEEVLALDHGDAIVTVAHLAALAANKTNEPLAAAGEGSSSPNSSAAEVMAAY